MTPLMKKQEIEEIFIKGEHHTMNKNTLLNLIKEYIRNKPVYINEIKHYLKDNSTDIYKEYAEYFQGTKGVEKAFTGVEYKEKNCVEENNTHIKEFEIYEPVYKNEMRKTTRKRVLKRNNKTYVLNRYETKEQEKKENEKKISEIKKKIRSNY